ncbi:MAG: acyltransferase family protein [Cryobacterium sp.]|uniref:acyltransferase family protein n=1 Tax=unclassified Cryobacterium TaxID=2649013 RepID=UPI0018CB608A|nr:MULTISPECIES: acyltransferase family protein [unclassified Cryobacterium]MCY7404112.1 acyltransferase family protein [Cryobacterium sp.]MEC5153494.1 putative membrane protein YcfT [Cryobacterium sp. CAN_C3]
MYISHVQEMRAENREWINFAKGAAIILVVLYHSSLFLNDLGLAGGTPRLRLVLGFFPMPVFFFIAGLTARRMLTWNLKDLWRRRLLTLVYLYLLWSVIRVGFYLVVPHLRGTERSPTDLLNIALLPVWPTSSYWFIWALTIFTLLAWLLRKLPVSVQIGLAGVLAIVSTTPGVLDLDNVGWDRVAANFGFFIVAVYFPHTVYRLAARVRVWHAIVLVAAYVGLAVLLVPLHLSRLPGLILLESAVAVAMGVALATLLVRVKWLNFMSTLGQYSFQIYLLHLFLVASALALLAPFAESPWLQRAGNALPFLLAAVALVASLYLAKLLRRFAFLWVSPFRKRQTKPVSRRAHQNGDLP